ncbi:hypothetical protein [Microcoleus sp. B9-D4]|uniref:hypothetical protein n=1 Tax=Microcoleus sp. B9-D4 TaxID=2818711 RepID=UPI002FD78C16
MPRKDVRHFLIKISTLSTLHQPWQAVNIAKNITNVAMAVRQILGVISVAMDIHAVKNEGELAQELSDKLK